MTAACFACGDPATNAVEITLNKAPLADGFVCDGCAGGKAIALLKVETRRLYTEGVDPDMIKHMIRQRIEGRRAQA